MAFEQGASRNLNIRGAQNRVNEIRNPCRFANRVLAVVHRRVVRRKSQLSSTMLRP